MRRSDRERGTDVRSQADLITERVLAIANLTNTASTGDDEAPVTGNEERVCQVGETTHGYGS